jgi:hypothetical protein
MRYYRPTVAFIHDPSRPSEITAQLVFEKTRSLTHLKTISIFYISRSRSVEASEDESKRCIRDLKDTLEGTDL